ncbi:unnamed protein product [Phyllotreta striolata]|uniref:Serpin domain-containing protein n=1 Tax=Phyllotreta striolata TaxID=444603 RepID=A0A9N9XMB0_PHYSR|nr:unnamed protein product [Phyllotreta striolata]
MKVAIIFLLTAYVVCAAPAEEEPLKALATGNRQFAANVYKEIVKTQKGNLIFSPFSAETVLALLSAGAKGDTHDELVSGLSLPRNQQTIQSAFKEFLPTVNKNTDDLKLLSANKIYAGKDVKLEADYNKIASDVYNSGVQNVDFEKNVEAAGIINSWVEEQTNNKIKDLIKPDAIDGSTAMVLVNALYMSAKWVNTFDKYSTAPQKFWRTKDNSVDVPMMKQIDHFRYYDNKDLGVKFLELPYIGDGLSMVIALPDERDGLTAIESNIEKIMEPQPMESKRVDVKLPKFKIESEIKFVDILKSLGVEKIFNPGANLSGLSATHKNLMVSDVIQKAFIDVTESGTEAAAATAVIAVERVMVMELPNPAPIPFHVDHPFSYFIKKDDVILFVGKIDNLN